MHIDIAKYERSKSFVLDFYYGKGRKEVNYTVSMGAIIYMVPCIVIAYWLGEELGWPPEVVGKIDRLIKFYDYKEILNKPPGAPI